MYNSYCNPILLHHVELWSYDHKIIEYYVRTSTIKSSNQNTKILYCNVLIGRVFFISKTAEFVIKNCITVSSCRHTYAILNVK